MNNISNVNMDDSINNNLNGSSNSNSNTKQNNRCNLIVNYLPQSLKEHDFKLDVENKCSPFWIRTKKH